ncbi:glycosidase [Persicobacter psychrovividus]|uniref:4-O-beta-D-mannosyl-D-glucose phosphorylase n=1 Tax=Persicobacter psychrovividus TaxID=387638 RepID=A0ABM7VLW6_9BACT|nr:4-O-beta-D-mannosyl-D-glucose phosphorylase [Persicobacter psychrovividus]
MFQDKINQLLENHQQLVSKQNQPDNGTEGYVQRYQNEVFTPAHFPPHWVYDLNESTNPHLAKRLGINAVFNPGAIFFEGKFYLMMRVEGYDRKSFFVLASSQTGVDQFEVEGLPIAIPQLEDRDVNVYDMRLTQHQDGYIYGTFCVERKDPDAKSGDESSAVAACGIIRSKDLKSWERLPDLITYSGQQRNVVLHPEFVDGKYALYTRPQDGFIDTGKGGGIGFGLSESMENAEVKEEIILDPKKYHTIKEVKNGQGPAPIKTDKGWLHLAHGVRNTAAGLRYVLYMFMTDLEDLTKVIARPGGYFMAPEGSERVGDVSNVLFVNGWIEQEGKIFIYYASSDTRIHVATSSVDQLVDYCLNTPEDPYFSSDCVAQRIALIQQNEAVLV